MAKGKKAKTLVKEKSKPNPVIPPPVLPNPLINADVQNGSMSATDVLDMMHKYVNTLPSLSKNNYSNFKIDIDGYPDNYPETDLTHDLEDFFPEQNDDNEQRIASYVEEIQMLNKQVDSLKSSEEIIEQQVNIIISSHEKELMRRDVQIEKLTQDMRMLKSEISKVEEEDDTVRQLTEEIELLTKEMAQLQSDAAREKEDLITQNENQQKEIEALSNEKQTLLRDIASVKTEMAHIQHDTSRTIEQLEQFNEKLRHGKIDDVMNERLVQLTQENAYFQQGLTQFFMREQQALAAIESNKQYIVQLQEELRKAQQSLTQQMIFTQALQNQKMQQQKTEDLCEVEMGKLRDEIYKLKQTVAFLRQENEHLEEENQILEAERDEQNETLEHYKKSVDSAVEVNKTLIQNSKEIGKQHTTALKNLEKEIANVKQEYKKQKETELEELRMKKNKESVKLLTEITAKHEMAMKTWQIKYDKEASEKKKMEELVKQKEQAVIDMREEQNLTVQRLSTALAHKYGLKVKNLEEQIIALNQDKSDLQNRLDALQNAEQKMVEKDKKIHELEQVNARVLHENIELATQQQAERLKVEMYKNKILEHFAQQRQREQDLINFVAKDGLT